MKKSHTYGRSSERDDDLCMRREKKAPLCGHFTSWPPRAKKAN